MKKLTLDAVMDVLAGSAARMQHWQIMDDGHPDYGGLVHPTYGVPDAHAAGGFAVTCAYLALVDAAAVAEWLPRAILAADYLLRRQRPSGNIDLLSVNTDSAPDTGFMTQQVCAVLELARVRQVNGPLWATLLAKLEAFVRRGVPGLCIGGFHTPNHRWVIASALVQAQALFPDLDVAATVDAYLAEGIDTDAEGMFIERSIGVYDAVNDRSWLLIAEHRDCPAALDAVARNLNLDLHFLHADGTAETGLSHRQDYGTRTVPLALAHCFLLLNGLRPNPAYVRAAQMLWKKSPVPGGATWLAYPLLKYGEPEPVEADLPENYTLFLPKNGIWRSRRDLLSASAFRDATRLFSLVYGTAELTSVKISHAYFGGRAGHFVSDALDVVDGRAVLTSEGRGKPRRPGYDLPLGRPVAPERWEEEKEGRDLRRLPPMRSTLTIEEVAGGFDLRYQTLDGLDGVAAQMAFDFPVGGIWETDDTATQPVAGQVLFLKQGHGTMRYGNDAIRIGSGAHAHAMWAMREAETAPGHVRVLLTFFTPVDFTVEVRVGRGSDWLRTA